MDPEEIAKRIESLKLSGRGKASPIFLSATEKASGSIRANKIIIGRIFGKRQPNREALREKLLDILQIRGVCEVEIVGTNTFAISLDLDSDRERIMTEGPWHWYNDLMLFKRVESMQTAALADFNEISIWIQLHNLPIACMETQIIRRIGEQVGTVQEVDEGVRGLCLGRYARVRVTRLLETPLVRGIPISAADEKEETMILVLYEKLPELLCTACGRIGHYIKDCKGSAELKLNPSFGLWMKAGRGIDYRRTTYPTNSTYKNQFVRLAAKENKMGPRPPQREEDKSQDCTVIVAAGDGKGEVETDEATDKSTEEMGGLVDHEAMIVDLGIDKGETGKEGEGVEVRARGSRVSTPEEVGIEGEKEENEMMVFREMCKEGKEKEGGVFGKTDDGFVREEGSESGFKGGTKHGQEGDKKSSKPPLPKKMKKNPAGRGWKRMARDADEGGRGRGKGCDDMEVGLLGKRRGEIDGREEMEGTPCKKMILAGTTEQNLNTNTMAEAAEQPRRAL